MPNTRVAYLDEISKYKELSESYVFKVERNIFSGLVIKSPELAKISNGLYLISVTTFKEINDSTICIVQIKQKNKCLLNKTISDYICII